MKALVLGAINKRLEYREVSDPLETEGDVVVQLKAAAINHRDLYIQQGLYPGIKLPIIPGSDGAGLTNEGREVIINPAINWGNNPNFPGKNFTILGLPQNGTFAEKVSVAQQQVYPKPSHLSWNEAAALPLAGLTAYRALFTKGQLQAGEKVLISGIGGGVALFAFQFAIAAGAEVYVTSGSDEKLEKARALGASGAFSYKEVNFGRKISQVSGGIDLIIDSAGGDGFSELVQCVSPGGKIVSYGGTRGIINHLSPQIIFWKQLSLLGTTMGNDAEFRDLLKFVHRHKIHPIVDSVWELKTGNDAFEYLRDGKQFGKVVIGGR